MSPSAGLRSDNPMKVGTFAMNCSSALTLTRQEGRLIRTWEEQPGITTHCDNGWDFLLSLARRRGWGGATNPNGGQKEVSTWATLAAITSSIQVISTAHVAMFEPLVAAKQSATIDQTTGGRFALNVVPAGTPPSTGCSAGRARAPRSLPDRRGVVDHL